MLSHLRTTLRLSGIIPFIPSNKVAAPVVRSSCGLMDRRLLVTSSIVSGFMMPLMCAQRDARPSSSLLRAPVLCSDALSSELMHWLWDSLTQGMGNRESLLWASRHQLVFFVRDHLHPCAYFSWSLPSPCYTRVCMKSRKRRSSNLTMISSALWIARRNRVVRWRSAAACE